MAQHLTAPGRLPADTPMEFPALLAKCPPGTQPKDSPSSRAPSIVVRAGIASRRTSWPQGARDRLHRGERPYLQHPADLAIALLGSCDSPRTTDSLRLAAYDGQPTADRPLLAAHHEAPPWALSFSLPPTTCRLLAAA